MSKAKAAEVRPTWTDLPSGVGQYWRNPDDPKKSRVKCPDCGKERERFLPSAGAKQFLSITGRDDVCAALNRSPLKGTLRHPSDAYFLFDKKEGIESPNVKVWIRCPNPDSNPDCEGEYIGYKPQWYKPEASCLCSSCVSLPGHGHTSRLITDKKITVYAWLKGGATKGRHIADVRYGPGRKLTVKFLLEACQHTETEKEWSRGTLKTRLYQHEHPRHSGDHFPRGCKACRRDPLKRAHLLLSANTNGNERKKDGGNGKAGRPPKFTDAEAWQAIGALGSCLSVNQLSKALKCSRPTINNWVERNECSSLSELVEKRRIAG